MNYRIINDVDNTGINTFASINKNNVAKAASAAGNTATDFAGVVVSGMAVDSDKLKGNTYESLVKEADDVKEQIMQNASEAKANLKSLFNRLNGSDAVMFNDEDFDLNEATADDMVNIVDRIKIELAIQGKAVGSIGCGIDAKKLESVVGSTAMAQSILKKMQEAGVPATDNNIEDMAQALETNAANNGISEDAKYYLISQNMDASINNINQAESAVWRGNSYNTAKHNVTDREWDSLRKQVENIIENAGLEINEQNLANAREFIERNIAVTEKNLQYKNELDNALYDTLSVAESIVKGMADGKSASTVSIVNSQSVFDEVVSALQIVNDQAYEYVADYLPEADITNLKSIGEAIAKYYEDSSVENNEKEQTLGNKMLLEVQILLTAQSGAYLAKQGISVMSESIATLHHNLLAYDQEKTMEEISLQLAEDVNVDVSFKESYSLSMEARRALFDLQRAPQDTAAVSLFDRMTGTFSVEASLTLENLASFGNSLRQRFKQAGKAYETLGTVKRTDLGDSLERAVNNSADAMLSDMDMEQNEANKAAVRILAGNNIDVTQKNVEYIKEINETLKSLIDNMTPENVMKMIRDNINPMKADIHDVEKYLKDNTSENISDMKYSTFLYKLDKTEGITPEERQRYIGIFKMMNMFTKDAGAAIGELVKQGADITMENLCVAYNSRKSQGNSYAIGEDTELVVSGTVNYYLNIFDRTGKYITPATLKKVDGEQRINERSVENFCEASQRFYDAQAEAAYMDEYLELVRAVSEADNNVLRELEQGNQPVNINNIQAMEMILNKDFFGGIFGKDRQRVEKMLNKLDSEESINSEYEELKISSDSLLKEEYNSTKDSSFEKYTRIRIGNQALNIINNLAKRHDYRVPFMTEDGVGMMKLTLVSDRENTGRISINYESAEYGEIALEVNIGENAKKTEAVFNAYCNSNESGFLEKLKNVAEAVKDQFDIGNTRVFCNQADRVYPVTYNDAAKKVPTNTLYRISKIIISNLV